MAWYDSEVLGVVYKHFTSVNLRNELSVTVMVLDALLIWA
jgi:hypothetical protein